MARRRSPIEGVSMAYSFKDAQAKSPHTVQYSEFAGNRGIYKDGWYAHDAAQCAVGSAASIDL